MSQQSHAEAQNQTPLAPDAVWQEISSRQRAYIIGPESSDLLDLAMAVVLCPALIQPSEPPVWLLLVGSPANGKTDTVKRLKGLDCVVAVDTFTGSALSTAYRDPKGGKSAESLLDRLNGKTLLLSDLASFFEQYESTVTKVLGELTAAFDGEFSKASGTSGTMNHTAQFALLGCTTPAHLGKYEQHISKIGSRFLYYRLRPLTAADNKKAKAAIRSADRSQNRAELTDLVQSHLRERIATGRHNMPEIESSGESRIEAMADLLASCRSVLDLENEVQQREGPSRAGLAPVW